MDLLGLIQKLQKSRPGPQHEASHVEPLCPGLEWHVEGRLCPEWGG